MTRQATELEGPNIDEIAAVLDADFGAWASTLSPVQEAALQDYQEGWANVINRYLRGHLDAWELEDGDAHRVGSLIEDIEEAVSAGELQRPVVSFRGVSDYPAVFGDLPPRLIGEHWVDPAFLSTTIDPEFAAQEFALAPRPAILKLCLAAGQSAAWLPAAGGRPYEHERELLLPCDSCVMIGEVHKEPSGLLVVCGQVLLP